MPGHFHRNPQGRVSLGRRLRCKLDQYESHTGLRLRLACDPNLPRRCIRFFGYVALVISRLHNMGVREFVCLGVTPH